MSKVQSQRKVSLSLDQPRLSSALSADENDRCVKFMSRPLCAPLTVGAAQLLIAQSSSAITASQQTHDHDLWKKQATGVVGFIKDWGRRSFFVRMVDADSEKVLWEFDTGNKETPLHLNSESPFCYFETQDGQYAGLLFANRDDAYQFKEVVDLKLNGQTALPQGTMTIERRASESLSGGEGGRRNTFSIAEDAIASPGPVSSNASTFSVPDHAALISNNNNNNNQDEGSSPPLEQTLKNGNKKQTPPPISPNKPVNFLPPPQLMDVTTRKDRSFSLKTMPTTSTTTQSPSMMIDPQADSTRRTSKVRLDNEQALMKLRAIRELLDTLRRQSPTTLDPDVQRQYDDACEWLYMTIGSTK